MNVFGPLDDMWQYSCSDQMWNPIQFVAVAPVERYGHSSVYWDEKMYIFGGWDLQENFNDVWMYEVEK